MPEALDDLTEVQKLAMACWEEDESGPLSDYLKERGYPCLGAAVLDGDPWNYDIAMGYDLGNLEWLASMRQGFA